MTPPHVSIIIPNFDSGELVLDLLKALHEGQEEGAVEILVMNHGTSNDLHFCRELFPSVRSFDLPFQHGYAGPCNAGWRRSRGRYLLFLNADTLVPGQVVEVLKTFLETEPETAIVAPQVRLFQPDGPFRAASVQTPAAWLLLLDHSPLARFAHFISDVRRRWEEDVHLASGKGPVQVPAVSGSVMMVRRSVFEALGGFDEGFISAYEDADLCLRARKAGHRVCILREAEAFHYYGSIRRRFLKDARSAAFRHAEATMPARFLARHSGPLAAETFALLQNAMQGLMRRSGGTSETEKPCIPRRRITLSWPENDGGPYLLEIAHSRLFLSKMWAVVEGNSFNLEASLLERFLPRPYYWRAASFQREPVRLTILGQGKFFPYEADASIADPAAPFQETGRVRP